MSDKDLLLMRLRGIHQNTQCNTALQHHDFCPEDDYWVCEGCNFDCWAMTNRIEEDA